MSKRKRRKYSSKEKADVLRRHLQQKEQVSDVCEDTEIQPSVFYGWQRQLFENAEAALVPVKAKQKASRRESELAEENARLKARLARRDEVIAEISEEYVKLKKELGVL
jgi:transposase-like protein